MTPLPKLTTQIQRRNLSPLVSRLKLAYTRALQAHCLSCRNSTIPPLLDCLKDLRRMLDSPSRPRKRRVVLQDPTKPEQTDGIPFGN